MQTTSKTSLQSIHVVVLGTYSKQVNGYDLLITTTTTNECCLASALHVDLVHCHVFPPHNSTSLFLGVKLDIQEHFCALFLRLLLLTKKTQAELLKMFTLTIRLAVLDLLCL